MVRAWKLLCRIALKKMGDSGAEVARFFGVTTSSVNRPAVSPEPPDPSKFPNALQNLRPPLRQIRVFCGNQILPRCADASSHRFAPAPRSRGGGSGAPHAPLGRTGTSGEHFPRGCRSRPAHVPSLRLSRLRGV